VKRILRKVMKKVVARNILNKIRRTIIRGMQAWMMM
jgi:hypothetical protein